MGMIGWLAGGAAAVVVLGYCTDTARYWTRSRKIDPIRPGLCRRIDGLMGPEDLALTREGRLIVSCDPRLESSAERRNGAIVALWPNAPEERAVLWDGAGKEFRPHGLDYFIDPGTGEEYLFVIDHRGTHDAVMIFRLSGTALRLVREVLASDTTSLNDLSAVSTDQFYVTSDHNSKSRLAKACSDYLRLPAGYVLYFDGIRLRPVASSINYANGIAVDRDKRHVYVASMLREKIIQFERDPQTGGLRRQGEIRLRGSPDNITLGEDGALVVAIHPRILDLARQRSNRTWRAPSEILHITRDAHTQAHSCVTIYADPGQHLSAASAAVMAGGRLFVGSVYDDHLVICDLPAVSAASPAPEPVLHRVE